MNILDSIQQRNIFEIMKSRRSVNRMTTAMPTRAQITRILEAATYAPNHYKVEPWKFFVISGKAREALGDVMAEAQAARLGDTTDKKAQALIQKERYKPLLAPVIIAVAVERPQLAWEREIENIAATSAAVQNMLLMAQELGLASLWRTGDAAYDPHVKAWFGLAEHDHIVAFVYLGFAACQLPERHPTHFGAKTYWLDDNTDWPQSSKDSTEQFPDRQTSATFQDGGISSSTRAEMVNVKSSLECTVYNMSKPSL